MSFDWASETEGTVSTKRVSGDQYANSVDTGGDRLSGYISVTSGSGAAIIGAAVQHRTPIPRPQRQVSISTPARRDALRRALAAAANEAMRMESFAGGGDLVELSNAGFALRFALEDLWDLRKEREEDWGDLLNLLQGALAQEEFERFKAHQCQTIRTIIVDHLSSGVTDIDDIERSIKLLREAGFDPWKGISSSAGSEREQGE